MGHRGVDAQAPEGDEGEVGPESHPFIGAPLRGRIPCGPAFAASGACASTPPTTPTPRSSGACLLTSKKRARPRDGAGLRSKPGRAMDLRRNGARERLARDTTDL